GKEKREGGGLSFFGQKWPESIVVRVRGRIKEERKRCGGYGVFRSKSLTGVGGRQQ
ncbi:hypothetical protein HAX54_046901, partial [Datura stramonium]|nr:hypothetical protein [Datura stramonium]